MCRIYRMHSHLGKTQTWDEWEALKSHIWVCWSQGHFVASLRIDPWFMKCKFNQHYASHFGVEIFSVVNLMEIVLKTLWFDNDNHRACEFKVQGNPRSASGKKEKHKFKSTSGKEVASNWGCILSVTRYANNLTWRGFIIIPLYTCRARLLDKLQPKILVWITDYFTGIGDGAKLILLPFSNQSHVKSIKRPLGDDCILTLVHQQINHDLQRMFVCQNKLWKAIAKSFILFNSRSIKK